MSKRQTDDVLRAAPGGQDAAAQTFSLGGRVALVTGASSGIGRAIALAYAAAGADVVLTYRGNRRGAEETAEQVRAAGRRAEPLQADIAEGRDVDALADAVRRAFGRVDVWVNNAGADILTGEAARLSGTEKLDRLLAVDLRGTAREGLGLCALIEGQRLLDAGKPADAEDWFRRASATGSPPDVVRGAFLGLGDVKLAQGDIPDALENYQQAIAGGTPGDTIAQRAHEKINAVGKADAPSTTPPKSP